jgi:hypothetical protein
MSGAVIISITLDTIIGHMISNHNHVTMHARHLMHTFLLVGGSSITGHHTLQWREHQQQNEQNSQQFFRQSMHIGR